MGYVNTKWHLDIHIRVTVLSGKNSIIIIESELLFDEYQEVSINELDSKKGILPFGS